MVNAAIPQTETNIRAMDTALKVLKAMADWGNTYLAARHSLLLELQAAIGPTSTRKTDGVCENHVDYGSNTVPVAPSGPQEQTSVATSVRESEAVLPATDWSSLPDDLPAIQDMTFNFDINDDPGLWEQALDKIDIDMDTEWIECALRR